MPYQGDSRRTVLITGCSSHGLGHALAIAFQHAGLRVFATARNPEKMAGLKELGIECLELDVCNEESIGACFEEVTRLTRWDGEEEGRLDCLVNNAGGGTSLSVSFPFSLLLAVCMGRASMVVWGCSKQYACPNMSIGSFNGYALCCRPYLVHAGALQELFPLKHHHFLV